MLEKAGKSSYLNVSEKRSLCSYSCIMHGYSGQDGGKFKDLY